MNTRVLAAAAASIAVAVGAPAALATSPGHVQYGNTLTQEAAPPSPPTHGTTTHGKAAAGIGTAPAQSGGALPFTGLDAALVVAGGAAAAAAGLGLRRIGRRRQS